MKRKIVLIMAICSLGLFGCSVQASTVSAKVIDETETATAPIESTSNFGFGMTMEEIRELEDTKPISENENMMAYGEDFSGYNTLYLYVFDDNKRLKDMTINFTDEYTTTAEYKQRFEILKTALISVYGKYSLSNNVDSYMWDNNNEKILLSMEKGKTVILFSSK